MEKFILSSLSFLIDFPHLLETANNLTFVTPSAQQQEGENKQTNLNHSKESGKIPSPNEVCNRAISSAWSPCQPQIKLRADPGVFRFLPRAHSAYSFTTCWVVPAFWSFRIKSKKKWAWDIFHFLGRCWDDGEDAQGRSLLVFYGWIPLLSLLIFSERSSLNIIFRKDPDWMEQSAEKVLSSPFVIFFFPLL